MKPGRAGATVGELIRYDFEPVPGKAPYRNHPERWLLQARERESWTRVDYRGARSRQTHWTRWRTVMRFMKSGEAFDMLAIQSASGLAQWRVTWGGKAMTRAEATGK